MRIQNRNGRPVTHYRVTDVILADTTRVENLNSELAQANSDKKIIILTGERNVIDALAPKLDTFRRFTPWRIDLPDVLPSELATVTLNLIQSKGYNLQNSWEDSSLPPHVQSKDDLMTYIIEQFYTQEAISRSNFYLSRDMQERAISNKNARITAGRIVANRVALRPTDFGVEVLSRMQIEKLRDEVNTEVADLVGCHELKDQIQMIRETVEFVQNGGDRTTLENSLNMVVTGNPGSGKTTFARIMFRFLRAYGGKSRDRWCDARSADRCLMLLLLLLQFFLKTSSLKRTPST